MATENRGSDVLTTEQVMKGVLALLIAEREDKLAVHDGREKFQPKKTELILSNTGMTALQIAGLVGKKPNTVTKTISRARAKGDGVTDG